MSPKNGVAINKERLSVLSSHLAPNPSNSMSSEKEVALAAVPSPTTIFDKITNKEIPAKIVFEDDKVLAFRDIQPQAPTHILIIPKDKDGLTGLSAAEERHCEILGRLLYTAKLVAKQEGLGDGFRIVINDGPSGCQYSQPLFNYNPFVTFHQLSKYYPLFQVSLSTTSMYICSADDR